MQTGSLAGVFAGGAAAALADDRRLATRLLVGGSSTWALAKGVKHFVRRGRPEAVFGTCRTLGRPQRGLGYPSGHAAVAASMATMATQVLPRRWWIPVWSIAALTAASRVYVGAHLPLDVVGGIGLGCATGALTDLVADQQH
jgi:membrane-associated phospholipid phosphatase